MHVVAAIVGILPILAILLDAFETVVLPRRVRRTFRISALVLPAHLDSMAKAGQPHCQSSPAGRIFSATSDLSR